MTEHDPIRDHPNYQREAFTVEEAESYAIKQQTVGAFRMLKALHEAMEQRELRKRMKEE